MKQQQLVLNPQTGQWEHQYVDLGPQRAWPITRSTTGRKRVGTTWAPLNAGIDPTSERVIRQGNG